MTDDAPFLLSLFIVVLSSFGLGASINFQVFTKIIDQKVAKQVAKNVSLTALVAAFMLILFKLLISIG